MNKIKLVLVLLSSVFSSPLYALEVISPHVEKGMAELELKNRFDFDSRAGVNRFRQHELGIGYGITENWKLELSAELEKNAGHGYTHSASEIENIFQFTELGEYWVDVGAKIAYEFSPQKTATDHIESYLLLEKDFRKFTSIANVGFNKDVGSNADKNPTGVLRFMSKYNYTDMLNPAIEYYGKFNKNGNTHSVGPAIYGKLEHDIKYNFGVLFGVSPDAPNAMLKFNLEYEFAY
jgi:hypothetical protein